MSSVGIWLFIKGLLHQDQRIHYHFIGTCIAQRTQSISISTYWIDKRRIDWFRPMPCLDWMTKGKVYMFAYSIYENGSVIDRLGNLLSFLPLSLWCTERRKTSRIYRHHYPPSPEWNSSPFDYEPSSFITF